MLKLLDSTRLYSFSFYSDAMENRLLAVKSRYTLPKEATTDEEDSKIEEEAVKEAIKEETLMVPQEEILETDLEDVSTVVKKAT